MNVLHFALLVVFVLSTCALSLLVKPQQRNILLARFRLLGLRSSTSTNATHPPLPDEKKIYAEATLDYKDLFPASPRDALKGFPDHLPDTGEDLILNETIREPRGPHKNLMPFDHPFDGLPNSIYTPTGFSIAEIRNFGDFPDYATLSGVPLPQPCKGFDISKALPRPYRPFRWTYHQTMSLAKLEPDWWLELESTYFERITQRRNIYEKNGKLVLQYLPGSELACKELMEMCLQFYCTRYPQYFILNTHEQVFDNKLLGTQTHLKAMHPLHVLLNNIPEDFAVMVRNPEDGLYYFRAGLLCSALGWNVDTKIGKRLHEIHEPVPDYKEKMQFSMDRFFAKLPADRPIQRGSWGFEVDTPLFMPPGDPHESYRSVQHPDLTLSRCHLRVDWQTLRRLPLSGAIVFNFKALFTPLEAFRDEPFIPRLALKILDEGKENMMQYKATWHTEHVVRPALEEWAREQVEKGWVPEDWDVRTLEESPFFPGWEQKWRREQGF